MPTGLSIIRVNASESIQSEKPALPGDISETSVVTKNQIVEFFDWWGIIYDDRQLKAKRLGSTFNILFTTISSFLGLKN